MPTDYQQTATNPQTGEKFGYDGQNWVSIAGPGPVKRALTSFVGVPEDVNLKDTSGIGDLGQWLEAAKQAVSSLNPVQGMSDANATARARFAQPGLVNKIQGAGEWLESGFPYAGPAAVRSAEQYTKGDVAGSVGSAAAAVLAHRAAPEIATRIATGPLRTAGQFLTGVGSDVVDQARKKFSSDLADLNDKIAQATGKNDASAAGAIERQKLSGEAQDTAADLGNKLLTAKEQATAVAKSLYPDINGTADAQTIDAGLKVAVAKNLRGSEKVPGIVGRIINEVEPQTSTSSARALTSKELEATKLIQTQPAWKAMGTDDIRRALPNLGFAPKEIDAIVSVARPEAAAPSALTFDKIHGYYSELGRELFNRDLPGDERATITEARNVMGDQMQKMAEAENKGYRFNVAQQNWAKLMNTFYNDAPASVGGSPVARALKAVDPVTKQIRPEYVQSVLSEPKSYATAQRLLSRYPAAKDLQASLQLMKEKMDEARSLPKTPKKVAVPEPPTQEVFDPVAARRAILQGHVPTGVTPGLFWRYALLRNLVRKLTSAPSVEDYLSQNPK